MTTVAEVLIGLLRQAGIARIYGIVGDSLNEITKVLGQQQAIQLVHVRHEEVAAFAAGAEAQLTGQLSVCMGSSGPGNLHLINGLYDCHRSQAPVLAIAADIPMAEIGSNYFQETHPHMLFKGCSHFCEVVSSPEQVPSLLRLAMQTAITQRGVAVLVISGDIAKQKINHDNPTHWTHLEPPIIQPDSASLQQAAQLLNNASKIAIFAGIGAADARAGLLTLAEKLQAPIVHTLRSKPYIEYDNPYDVGMTGFIGFASGYYAIEDCEVLVLVGASFPYRQFYPSKARIIQIDIAGPQLGKRTPIDIGLIGDAGATLQALLPLLTTQHDKKYLTKALAHYKASRAELSKLARTDEHIIHPQYLMTLVDQLAAQDAIFCCDVGTPTVWSARYLHMNGQRRLIGSFNHGSMANALAQAIGAQISHPDRAVIACCGDGGLSMLLGDVLTLIQHQLPIKIIVFNNQSLGFVKLEMHAAGMLDFGTDLAPTNFAEIAKAAGIFGVQVTHSAELAEALQLVLQQPGPALLDVLVDPNELIIPPAIKAQQIKGFGVYMIKAVLDGQGGTVFDLAKSNLWK